jgi:valyl-tRNA synthetase
MVMLGTELMGCLPFKQVFLHSIVRDAHGRKMSKSLGNVIDPIDVIHGIHLEGLLKRLEEGEGSLDTSDLEKAKEGLEADFPDGIPECGTDALRFALVAELGQEQDMAFDLKQAVEYRDFCDKLWLAIKFTLIILGPDFTPNPLPHLTGNESKLDLWLMSKVWTATEACCAGFEGHDLSTSTTACHSFWVNDLCNGYFGCLKPVMQGTDEEAKENSRQTLYKVVDIGLRLLHPFMPFITEELYQRLPRRVGDTVPSICVAPYPEVRQFNWTQNEQLEKDVDFMQTIVHNVMSLRSEHNLLEEKVQLYLKCDGEVTRKRLEPFLTLIQMLTISSSIECLDSEGELPEGCTSVPVNEECDAFLLLRDLIEVKKEGKSP